MICILDQGSSHSMCVYWAVERVPAVTRIILTFRWHWANHCFQWDVCMVRDRRFWSARLYSALNYVFKYLFFAHNLQASCSFWAWHAGSCLRAANMLFIEKKRRVCEDWQAVMDVNKCTVKVPQRALCLLIMLYINVGTCCLWLEAVCWVIHAGHTHCMCMANMISIHCIIWPCGIVSLVV